jgi:hypothetical protein
VNPRDADCADVYHLTLAGPGCAACARCIAADAPYRISYWGRTTVASEATIVIGSLDLEVRPLWRDSANASLYS